MSDSQERPKTEDLEDLMGYGDSYESSSQDLSLNESEKSTLAKHASYSNTHETVETSNLTESKKSDIEDNAGYGKN